eukprot:365988-Chlamydomonas_euryale.AAC.1
MPLPKSDRPCRSLTLTLLDAPASAPTPSDLRQAERAAVPAANEALGAVARAQQRARRAHDRHAQRLGRQRPQHLQQCGREREEAEEASVHVGR